MLSFECFLFQGNIEKKHKRSMYCAKKIHLEDNEKRVNRMIVKAIKQAKKQSSQLIMVYNDHCIHYDTLLFVMLY